MGRINYSIIIYVEMDPLPESLLLIFQPRRLVKYCHIQFVIKTTMNSD